MKIRTRLVAMLGLAALLLVGLGGFGLLNLQDSNASLKTVYEDRVVALGELNTFARRLQRTQWYIALAALESGERQRQEGEVAAAIANGAEAWNRFRSTYLTEEEIRLAQEIEAVSALLAREIYGPARRAILAGDEAAIRAVAQLGRQRYALIRSPLDKIIQLQLDVAQAEYTAGQAHYQLVRAYSLGAIVLGLAVLLALGLWVIRSVDAPLAEAVEAARAVAQGDLTRRIEARAGDEVGQLVNAQAGMHAGLVQIVSQVRSGAELISTASSEIAQGNLDLSARTEQQASSLEETAASLEQLTATVRQNADNAAHANSMAAQAAQTAELGGQEMQRIVDTMGTIRASSTKVEEIIAVIDGIAFQTNILALNAAVEAARAGEQGRGFAVVASEVRNLAQKSAAAAREIKDLITTSVGQINQGSALVEQAGHTMQQVVVSITQVRDLVGEISHASQEQTMGIGQINQAVGEMDRVTQQNAALVEQAAAAAQALEEQAAQLMAAASMFKLQPGAAARRLAPLRPRLPA